MTADRLTEDVEAIREALWLLKGAAPMGTVAWFPDVLARLDNVATVVSQLQDALRLGVQRCEPLHRGMTLDKLREVEIEHFLEVAEAALSPPASVLLPPPSEESTVDEAS